MLDIRTRILYNLIAINTVKLGAKAIGSPFLTP